MDKITKKIHLDFHTGPDIEGVGSKFDKKDFQNALKKANVQSITLFAKCHHGYTYYPSKVGKIHPHLDFDLLGAQIEAAHEIGVSAPVYIPVGWSHLDSELHPEWCAVDFYTKKKEYYGCTKENADKPRTETLWSLLCPTGDYLTELERLTEEICERYKPVDGMFFDICFMGMCVCDHCKAEMIKTGLNPEIEADVKIHYKKTRIDMMKRLSDIVKRGNSKASVFFNGSCTLNNDPEFLEYQSHFEMEVLPTVYGSFDETDFHCRKLENFHKDIFGMTARFQHSWGEFGGYKDKEALKYEIANCLSLGAGVCVGDHCHPNGKMDNATYENVAYVYSYMKAIEKYCLNTERVADVGVVIAESQEADDGVNTFLLEKHVDYKIVFAPGDLVGLKLIILPDNAIIDDKLCVAIKKFAAGGGKILASGSSLKDYGFGIEYDEPKGERYVDYIVPDFDIGLYGSPLLMNTAAYKTSGEQAGFSAHTAIYDPYFTRTNAHFSGHKNTPYKEEKSSTVGLWKKKNITFFAHDVFTIYNKLGSPYLKNYIAKEFDELYGKNSVEVEGFSSVGRVRLRKNSQKGFYALHLLYASQCKRKNCYTLEDFPAFYNTKVKLRVPETITEARCLQSGEEITFERTENGVEFVVPEWRMHALIVLKYRSAES